MTTNVKTVTSIRLSEDLLDALKKGAVASNRSLNNYIECILKESMERESIWSVVANSEKEIQEGNCKVVSSKEEQKAFLESL